MKIRKLFNVNVAHLSTKTVKSMEKCKSQLITNVKQNNSYSEMKVHASNNISNQLNGRLHRLLQRLKLIR